MRGGCALSPPQLMSNIRSSVVTRSHRGGGRAKFRNFPKLDCHVASSPRHQQPRYKAALAGPTLIGISASFRGPLLACRECAAPTRACLRVSCAASSPSTSSRRNATRSALPSTAGSASPAWTGASCAPRPSTRRSSGRCRLSVRYTHRLPHLMSRPYLPSALLSASASSAHSVALMHH